MDNGERREANVPELRKEEAKSIIRARRRDLAELYGTDKHCGSDPSRWKPYHVIENRIWTKAVKKVFNAAFDSKTTPGQEKQSSILANLQQDDLPAMLIAASCLYPDFDDLYEGNSTLAIRQMERSGLFEDRDFAIADACIKVAVGDEDIEAPSVFNGNTFDFTAQKKVFLDAIAGCNHSLFQTPYLVALLGLERLIEKNAIHIKGKKGKRLPRTLAEVIHPDTKYTSDVLRDHIIDQNDKFFGEHKEYTPHLRTSELILPYFSANKAFFLDSLYSLHDQGNISMARLLRKTRRRSLSQRSGKSRDGWVASLN